MIETLMDKAQLNDEQKIRALNNFIRYLQINLNDTREELQDIKIQQYLEREELYILRDKLKEHK